MIQALTPGQLGAATNVLSVLAIMIGVPLIVCGTAEVIGWWRKAGRVVDDAAASVCLYCRGIDWCANCTCTKKCTAMVCLWGTPKAAEGTGQK